MARATDSGGWHGDELYERVETAFRECRAATDRTRLLMEHTRHLRDSMATQGSPVPKSSGADLPPKLNGHQFTNPGRQPGVPPSVTLTPRETEVLKLIAEGKNTREIAALLGIAFKTAVAHRTSMMAKLDVHETATLVRYAIRLGLIQP